MGCAPSLRAQHARGIPGRKPPWTFHSLAGKAEPVPTPLEVAHPGGTINVGARKHTLNHRIPPQTVRFRP